MFNQIMFGMCKANHSSKGCKRCLLDACKFPLCFKSRLNSCRDLPSFNFIGRLFHKTLPLKFNELIPYF